MFHPRSLLLILALLLSAVTAVHSSLDSTAGLGLNCSDPAYHSCDFYLQCAEARFQCGSDGYPVNYGNRYCNKFSLDQGELSEAGKKWMWDVMKCLEDALAPAVTAQKQITCNQLSREAFDSHPYCYVRSGLCALPLSDLVAIVEIIGLKSLIHIEMFKQVFIAGGLCATYYLGVVVDKFLPWSQDAAQIVNHTIVRFSTEQLLKDMNKQS